MNGFAKLNNDFHVQSW